MNADTPMEDFDAVRWINRLADDELDERSQHILFDWLDVEPARWRHCALALLEVRELQTALDDWSRDAVSVPKTKPVEAQRQLSLAVRRRCRLAITATVACVAAFGLGMVVDRQWSERDQMAHAAASKIKTPMESDRFVGEPKVTPVRNPAATTSNLPDQHEDHTVAGEGPDHSEQGGVKTAMLPDYIRSQLERQGYRVNSQQRLVSVTLPSGRHVTIPVEEWKFQYAGQRVY